MASTHNRILIYRILSFVRQSHKQRLLQKRNQLLFLMLRIIRRLTVLCNIGHITLKVLVRLGPIVETYRK
jgi:hypothetical protein